MKSAQPVLKPRICPMTNTECEHWNDPTIRCRLVDQGLVKVDEHGTVLDSAPGICNSGLISYEEESE